ncbi:MAG TPA: hypothetical protein IAC74_03545 [Candidatus Aphodoplasma excrementigallinarum]|uniref:Uncharacterized protein n=1 Tax=Candidatus Aphodoplasma excrementigallinarum TaxID=2840673 RepID=A0A9D1NGD6_9FIRM|nr:hypothetical protein [Candidatus Aphodoplasma excrementigallinarum]
MFLKILGVIVVVIGGAGSFFAKKLLPAVLKREVSAEETVKFKMLMLLFVAVGACLVILPDYL